MKLPAGYSHILRSKLFARYAAVIAATICGLLAIVGALQIVEAWTQNVSGARVRLGEQADAAALRIGEHLAAIERQVQAVTTLPWATAELDPQERAFEYARLQRVIPSLTELRSIDESRRERLRVSQLGPNAVGSGSVAEDDIPRAGAREPAYGDALFRSGVDPYVWIAFPEERGQTAALVNMKFISDFVARIRLGRTGKAFVVDRAGFVIAHPDLRVVLRRLNVADYPSLANAMARKDGPRSGRGPSFDASDVEFAGSRIGGSGWWTFVELSREELLEPVWQAAYRLAILTLVGLLLAGVLALWLARHLSAPIVQLRRAAARIGAGDLEARAMVNRSDELKGLADEFNAMAGKLQDSHASLERKVESRTRELAAANVQLAARKQEADEANAAKTRFLATASHDLRQPMHAIGLLVGVLKEHASHPGMREVIQKIENSVEAMDGLFANLLDISKLDAGAIKPNLANVDMRALLQRVDLQYGPLAAARSVRLRVVPSSLVVRSDPALLDRIAGNLVSNAIRYTTRGTILVGCRRQAGRAVLQVIDTGCGIPAEHLESIFDEFFQLGAPGEDRGVGLGLGLSIVKRSAALLAHPIRVSSVPGKGSAFCVELPRVAGGRAERGAMVPPRAGEALAGAFVIAIDDDATNRLATESLFTLWGCDVLAAASSEEASAALEGMLRGPDLIVTDLRLGKGDSGLDAITRIKESWADVPAILLTGDVTIECEARSAQESGVVVLHKPVSPQQLRRVVEALISD